MLALGASAPACTPVAVGAVAVGGTSLVEGLVTMRDCSDPDDNVVSALCDLNNVVGVLLVLLGGRLIAGGGIYLSR